MAKSTRCEEPQLQGTQVFAHGSSAGRIGPGRQVFQGLFKSGLEPDVAKRTSDVRPSFGRGLFGEKAARPLLFSETGFQGACLSRKGRSTPCLLCLELRGRDSFWKTRFLCTLTRSSSALPQPSFGGGFPLLKGIVLVRTLHTNRVFNLNRHFLFFPQQLNALGSQPR